MSAQKSWLLRTRISDVTLETVKIGSFPKSAMTTYTRNFPIITSFQFQEFKLQFLFPFMGFF